MVGRQDKERTTMLPTRKNNAAAGYQGAVKMELLKGAGLLIKGNILTSSKLNVWTPANNLTKRRRTFSEHFNYYRIQCSEQLVTDDCQTYFRKDPADAVK